MFLSWLIIFAHGIIPHNHTDEPHPECHNLLHSAGLENNGGIPAECCEKGHAEKVCHYSGFVFHHLSDNIVLISEKPGYTDPPEVYTTGNIDSETLLISDPCGCISSLRGPPAL